MVNPTITLVYHQGSGAYVDLAECEVITLDASLVTKLENQDLMSSFLDKYTNVIHTSHNYMVGVAKGGLEQ